MRIMYTKPAYRPYDIRARMAIQSDAGYLTADTTIQTILSTEVMELLDRYEAFADTIMFGTEEVVARSADDHRINLDTTDLLATWLRDWFETDNTSSAG